ncbi:MAG: trypsin-like peptidase domain-containing protein, partial [Patescibacteria group bacterium]
MHAATLHTPKRSVRGPRGSTAVAVVALILSLGAVGTSIGAAVYAGAGRPVTQTAQILPTGQSISDLYKEISPSAVFIFTSSNLVDEYGDVLESAASGSGVIVNSDGYIITNSHVVTTEQGNGDITVNPDVQVALSDKRVYVARVLGLDLINDIAVLKIEERNLPAAEFGSMESVDIGDQIIAIGSPAGTFVGDYRNTLTSGMVGGLNQTYGTFEGSSFIHNDLIQHSAAINPGNSGGPLFDAAGKLIGINTLREIGDNQAIFFALP